MILAQIVAFYLCMITLGSLFSFNAAKSYLVAALIRKLYKMKSSSLLP